MAAQHENVTNNRSIVLLFILILSVALAIAFFWFRYDISAARIESLSENQNKTVSPKAIKGQVISTQIESVEFIDINFWEARIKTSYSLESSYKRGYLSFYMLDWAPKGSIGLVTRPGHHEGIAIIDRHLNSPKAYTSKKLRGRMYDPYRHDRNYFEEDFSVILNWPGADELNVSPGENKNKFSEVKRVFIYRNVPRYIEFAESLVGKGFYPERIGMQLAVCHSCPASLIFGEDISVESLQAILSQLNQHGFPINKVEFSKKLNDVGIIRIGQTPSKDSKPLWENYNSLMQEDISIDDFLSIIGFERESEKDRAIALHKRAKTLIDNGGRRNLAKARKLLDRAQELDSNYMPIYIEMSRYLMRSSREYSMHYPTETGYKAKTVLESSLKIDPDFSNTYVLLGHVQTGLHEFDKAMSSFKKAKELGTNNLWLHHNLAFLHEQQGDLPKAIKELEKLLDHKIDHSDNDRAYKYGLNRLSKHYIHKGNHNQTRKIFEHLRNDFPSYMEPLENYVMFLLSNTNDEKRISELFEDIKSRNCSCYEKILTMMSVIKAADTLSTSNSEAIKHLIRAQSTKASFSQAIAELAKGEQGRKKLKTLFENIIKVEEIESNESILSHLIHTNDSKVIMFFLNKGANPNSFNPENKMTPLMLAIASNNSVLVKVFLEHGADPNLKSPLGFSAYDLSREIGNANLLGGAQNEHI